MDTNNLSVEGSIGGQASEGNEVVFVPSSLNIFNEPSLGLVDEPSLGGEARVEVEHEPSQDAGKRYLHPMATTPSINQVNCGCMPCDLPLFRIFDPLPRQDYNTS